MDKIEIPKADFRRIITYLTLAKRGLESNPNNKTAHSLFRIWLETLNGYDTDQYTEDLKGK